MCNLKLEMSILKIMLLLVLTKQIGCNTTLNQDTRQSLQLRNAEATELCSRNGGRLASYNESKSDHFKLEYLSLLESGESIWLADHAKFSPFISLEGCYSKTGIKHTIRLVGVKSVYDCINGCFNKGVYSQYIGIQRQLCYCLTKRQFDGPKIKRVHSSSCSITCDYNYIDMCGSYLHMSVYKLFPANKNNTPINVNSKELCIYMHGIYKYKTYPATYAPLYSTSCYGQRRAVVGGYFCVDGFGKLEAPECSTSNKTYCFMDGRAVSRIKAEEKCLSKNGVLADHQRTLNIVSRHENFQSNRSYWTHTYRTFALSKEEDPDDSVCLAAVKQKLQDGDILAIEPSDCALKRDYFCSTKEKVLNLFTRHVPSDLTHLGTSLSDYEYTTKLNYPKHESTVLRNNHSVLPTISLCFSVTTFILLIVVVCILYRLRKRLVVPTKGFHLMD